MGLSTGTLVAVVLLNSAFVGLMYFTQEVFDRKVFDILAPRHSIIVGTSHKFLYMQDFWTMTLGDLFGVPLILNAFVHLAVNGNIGLWQWLAFAVIVPVDATLFYRMCTSKNHKPDMGYPDAGQVSITGLAHLPYHGICVAAALFAAGHAFAGNVTGSVLGLALLGVAVYIFSFAADVVSGNFDPLRK